MSELDLDWLCRRIVEGTPDAVLFASPDGRIRLWGGGAEQMFGYSAAEALGQSLDLVVPERLRARHWEGWERVMATGTTRYGREVLAVPATRKDGTSLSIEFTVQLVRDGAGALVGVAAVMRDVTSRFQREKELQRRIKEMEARLAERG